MYLVDRFDRRAEFEGKSFQFRPYSAMLFVAILAAFLCIIMIIISGEISPAWDTVQIATIIALDVSCLIMFVISIIYYKQRVTITPEKITISGANFGKSANYLTSAFSAAYLTFDWGGHRWLILSSQPMDKKVCRKLANASSWGCRYSTSECLVVYVSNVKPERIENALADMFPDIPISTL